MLEFLESAGPCRDLTGNFQRMAKLLTFRGPAIRRVAWVAGAMISLSCEWNGEWTAPAVASASASEPNATTSESQRPSVDQDLAALAATGPNSAGSAEAQAAAERLRHAGPDLLPKLLRVMDNSNAVGANWARTVFEDITERLSQQPVPERPVPERPATKEPAIKEPAPKGTAPDKPAAKTLVPDERAIAWPLSELQNHVRDRTRGGKSRRLALRLVERLDPAFAPPWLLTCRDDPEFRSDAVDATLRAGDTAAKEGDREAARQLYHLAFVHARESEQVLLAARKLGETGEAVDPIRHLGFLVRWHLVGPFDAPGTSGFDAVFPPQDPAVRFDPLMKFANTSPANNSWKIHETRDRLGQVDLIQALAAARESVGYAYAEFETPQARDAQVRCSADDNITVWLNGAQVLARRQWLNGTRLDRFIAPVKLEAGTNRLLVKICQGPQHADPAVSNNWSFQLRLCDESGAGIPFSIRSPAPAPPAKTVKPVSPINGAPR